MVAETSAIDDRFGVVIHRLVASIRQDARVHGRDHYHRSMLLPMDGSEASGGDPARQQRFTGHNYVAPAFSPDGRWMAYHSNSRTESGLCAAIPGPGGKWRFRPTAAPSRSGRAPARSCSTPARTPDHDGVVHRDWRWFTASKPRAWADTQFLPRNEGSVTPADRSTFTRRRAGGDGLVPENERFGRQDKLVFVFNFFDELRRLRR